MSSGKSNGGNKDTTKPAKYGKAASIPKAKPAAKKAAGRGR